MSGPGLNFAAGIIKPNFRITVAASGIVAPPDPIVIGAPNLALPKKTLVTNFPSPNGLGHLQDLEMEAVVLGTLIHDGSDTFQQIGPLLRVDDFVVERHRQIFTSALRVASEVALGIDSVAHDLIERGKLESIGGFTALMDIDAQGIPGLKLENFARKLHDKANKRRAITLAAKIATSIEHELAGPEAVRNMLDELRSLTENTDATTTSILTIEDLPSIGSIDWTGFEYIIEPVLPLGAVVALTGASGCGKSTLATAWARDAIAAGRPVLFLDRENPHQVIADRNSRLNLSDSELLHWWGGWNSEGAPDPASDIVVKWVRACELKPLIVIDSLIAFHGGDENDAALMRTFFNGPRKLADMGATSITIHHNGKGESSFYRGSSDFPPSIDQGFHVTNYSRDPGKLDRLTLECFKSRYGLGGQKLTYTYAHGQFIPDQRVDAPARTQAMQLTALLRQMPGLTSEKFEVLALKSQIPRGVTREFLAKGVLAGEIRDDKGAHNAHHYSLIERGE